MSEGGCTAKEPFALQVLGTSMEPEFEDGAVIVVDPAYPAKSGAYVVVDHKGETTLRQLIRMDDGRLFLCPLNPSYPTVEVTRERYHIRGVVVQQARRGARKKAVHYQ